MERRDYFAASALQGMLGGGLTANFSPDEIVNRAVNLADLLEQRLNEAEIEQIEEDLED